MERVDALNDTLVGHRGLGRFASEEELEARKTRTYADFGKTIGID